MLEWLRRVSAFSVAVLAGCPSMPSGGELVRPETPTVGNVLGEGGEDAVCREPGVRGTPLVLDWSTQDRMDLEEAMHDGVAVVEYRCGKLRLIPGCRTTGGYGFLGMSTGVNLSRMPHDQKQAAYAADITYGTNNEFGFDYLRDNMVYSGAERVQRGLNFAIVDEVDSILIDEARTPLIISGQAEDHTDLYLKLNQVPPLLKKQEGEGDQISEPGDYTLDLKSRQVLLTEAGHENAEQILTRMGLLPEGASLYDPGNILLVHHLYAALRGHALYHKDQQYVVQNGEVVIVDEFTGRLMPGRRWSDGLHQAVEAKEGVKIQAENQTLASITFQNYFRMYGKLAGMTGTADTEAFEFHSIYGLETVIVPTNRPMTRKDGNDKVYRTAPEKWTAVIDDIKSCVERGQPVLVGTTSIEVNEFLSRELKKQSIAHQLLNAKQHDSEAGIVAQAGRPGVVTIATNMAGRGTDIVLGGNIEREVDALRNDANLPDSDKEERIASLRGEWKVVHDKVVAAGGLHIIGTERHESRRIDNQLRGRAGRQGDPGSSRFYLSLEDPLMKIFAGERLNAIMVRLKMPEGEAIEHTMVTRSLESAQRKVELAVVHSMLDGRQLVEFSVVDSGGGLPPEVLDRLYEAFHSTKSYGMGIGLSLCRSIVESHQGRIRAENLYNAAEVTGCRFSFWLPVGEPASVAPELERTSIKTPG